MVAKGDDRRAEAVDERRVDLDVGKGRRARQVARELGDAEVELLRVVDVLHNALLDELGPERRGAVGRVPGDDLREPVEGLEVEDRAEQAPGVALDMQTVGLTVDGAVEREGTAPPGRDHGLEDHGGVVRVDKAVDNYVQMVNSVKPATKWFVKK